MNYISNSNSKSREKQLQKSPESGQHYQYKTN